MCTQSHTAMVRMMIGALTLTVLIEYPTQPAPPIAAKIEVAMTITEPIMLPIDRKNNANKIMIQTYINGISVVLSFCEELSKIICLELDVRIPLLQ